MRRLLPTWLAICLLLLAGAARGATTVAVVPLAKGAGSATYDGLGTALAGMLIADLGEVESLQPVERERLDALLEEIELAEAGFVDPETAQRLGRGLGAELVLTGSWSVVDGTFLMDTRLVRVESSAVVKASRADGPVGDFVSVEKQVIEDLLDGLEVELSAGDQRRLLLQSPTESFEAFAAYGEGLARQSEGDLDAAASAFGRAVSTDPEFEAARSALASIKARLEARRAEDQQREVSERDRALLRTLEETVDERARKGRHPGDLDSLSRFALRLSALDELGRHCQRYQEMRHFLDRVRGGVDLPPETGEPYVLVETLSKHAWALGLAEKSYPDEQYSRDMRVMSAGTILGNPETFLLDLDAAEPGHYKSDSLYKSMSRCLPPSEHLPTLAALREDLRRWGVADTSYDNLLPTVTLDDKLEAFVLQLMARRQGVDAGVEARVQALLDRFERDDEGRTWATMAAERIVREGEAWERHAASRQGLPTDTLLGLARAVIETDEERLRLDRPFCAHVLPLVRDRVADDVERWQQEQDGPRRSHAPYALDGVALALGPLLDMGCFAGLEARFDTADQAMDWLDAARERARPERADEDRCVEAWKRWAGRPDRDDLTEAFSEQQHARLMWSALTTWYAGLLPNRCVVPQPRAEGH